ncbi:MAG: malto-oligosyltrehalose synthase, partial [Thermodesulfobacteriota bacterium]|nr:malto-oligosyltrehalose synthase [Thermodesulfobacteriota bacterium]
EHPDFQKFLGVLSILKIIPSKEEVSERSEQIKFIKNMLWELYTTNDEIKKYIDENVKSFNGQKGNPESFNILDSLLSEQFFRLSFWKVATEEINYRRFFNINDLISLKVENEDVFHHTHHLIFKLIEERRISGLRIDHIDGLYDPVNYLRRVREKAKDIYIVVEKILDQDEEIPSFWPIQGTTGYESLDFINGIHSKGESEREFTKIYSRFIAFKTPHREILSEKKRLITGKHMAGDIDNLAQLAKRISSKDRYGGDITLYGLKRAFVEVMTFFPVYRTYINHEIFSEMDQSYIKKAIGEATRANPGLLYELNFIERFLLLKFDAYLTLEDQRQWLHFVMRFQQFTGPLMAKGFEDTFLYVYNRLISLNEVGGSPHRFGISLEAFSSFNEKRAHCLPHSMNATSTHDTKRGEDVRARINVLSELPEEWRNHIKLWSRINRKKKKSINGVTVPERNDEYFLYQTLIGTFPFSDDAYPSYVERIKDYIIKAVREAKVHTAWLKPDTEYEHAFLSFIEDILDSQGINRFLKEFIPFQKKVAFYGVFNSLTQTLLKMTIPGVPDFYQGTELWDLNLVDPDNRRPVDFEKRKVFLKDIKEKAHTDLLGLISELLSAREDGRIKLFLIYKVLNVRKEMSKVFQKGAYIPIQSDGKHKDHVVVFARNYRNTWVLVIAPRFLTSLISEGEYPHGINVWYDTYINLPEGAPLLWKDVFSGQVTQCEGTLLVGEVLNYFSVTVLVGNVKSSMKKEKKI